MRPVPTTSSSSTARTRSPTSSARGRSLTNALYEGNYPLVSALSRPVIAAGGRRDRARARRRGGRPRLHRQGQRPAPLRARLQGALPGREGDRAAARPDLDARRGDRVRARARASRSCRRAASPFSIDENLFGRAIEAGVLEDPWNAPPEEPYALTSDPASAPAPIEIVDRLRAGHPGLARRRGALARRAHRAGEPARRRLRDRADRHDREPRRGHQEPRGLRGAGRDDAHRRALGARGRRPHEGRGAAQAAARAALDGDRLRGSLVQPAHARRSTRSSTRRRSSSRERSGSSSGRTPRSSPAAARRT